MSNLCWLRRDLRLHDHHALSSALQDGKTYVAFIFDSHILEKLASPHDLRISFIMQSLQEVDTELQKYGSSLIIRHGKPEEEIPKIANELKVNKVFANRDYSPYAKDRDQKTLHNLKDQGIDFQLFKDCVFFEKYEVLNKQGAIYKVFTPYKKRWLQTLEEFYDSQIPTYETNLQQLMPFSNDQSLALFDWYQEINFLPSSPLLHGGTSYAMKRLKDFHQKIDSYDHDRDFPSLDGTSSLSPYIRHGCLSVRDMLRAGLSHSSGGARTWISEIIWRDFYQMILDAFPYVAKKSFKKAYEQIVFIGEDKHFEAWKKGETGFPIVDAAMRCLNETGMMHNRLRMIVASFLCKTLLIHWRKGEAYFAEKLLDYDLAANNGGWQWSSSSGCDAQPYFRIFNPYTQSEKFDPDGKFIKKWIPELQGITGKDIHKPQPLLAPNYPQPIVHYESHRKICLEMYSVVKAT